MSTMKQWKDEYGFGRPMSNMESTLDKFHRKEMWVLVRTLVVNCEEKPSIENVNEALEALMKWNPSLRMGIRRDLDGDGEWHFYEQTDAKPRLECLYNEEDWKKVMEDEMLRPIENRLAPQFRCVFLPNAKYNSNENDATCAFVFAINHGIIDGMSAMATLRKFRRLLNHVVMKKTLNIEPWPKMHPPVDHFFKREIAKLPDEKIKELESIPKADLSALFNEKCLFTDKRGIESKKNASIPFRTCLTIKEFNRDETEKLRVKCREHNATIQAAAQVAGAVALAQMLQDSDDWKDLKIDYNLAANMRPRIAQEISVDYTGAYVAVLFGFSTTVGQTFGGQGDIKPAFWKLAQQSTATMREQIKNQDYLQTSYAFSEGIGEEENLDAMLKDVKNEGRGGDLLYTTSYGAWEFPFESDDAIKPLAAFSNSSIHKFGGIFSQQLITVNGKMTWTIGWSQRVVSQETADEFSRLMFAVLETAVED